MNFIFYMQGMNLEVEAGGAGGKATFFPHREHAASLGYVKQKTKHLSGGRGRRISELRPAWSIE